MKNAKKIGLNMLVVFLVLMVMVLVGNGIFASSPVDTNIPDNIKNSSGISNVNNAVGSIWGTVVLILQVAAIGAIIFAGVRYMFASADAKADIKKQTLTLVLGAILVFGATTLVQFLTSVVDDVVKVEPTNTPNTPKTTP